MSEVLPQLNEKRASDSIEKVSVDSDGKHRDNVEVVDSLEAFEERLQMDDASDKEYLVEHPSDVAVKVFLRFLLQLRLLMVVERKCNRPLAWRRAGKIQILDPLSPRDRRNPARS